MNKEDDLSGIDIDVEDFYDEQESYLDYLDALAELKAERARCERYAIPEDEYYED